MSSVALPLTSASADAVALPRVSQSSLKAKSPAKTCSATWGGEDAYVAHYQAHGFAVVRGVFRPEEVRKLSHACDRNVLRRRRILELGVHAPTCDQQWDQRC